MIELPADVEDRYRQLARSRRWPPEVETAFRAAVGWQRELDESDAPRTHYEFVDDDGLVDKGARFLWETVPLDGAVVAVKQLEVSSDGTVRRYSWRCLEDDHGGLTDQPLAPEQPGLNPVPSTTFHALWDTEQT